MPPKIQVLSQWNSHYASQQAFAREVQTGLSSIPKRIPSAYLYDENGDRIFQKIMDMPEYYPTNCEMEILETHKEKIADKLTGYSFRMIELGPGDGRKTEVLLNHFCNCKLDFEYVPIDISHSAIQQLMDKLSCQFPKLRTRGLVCDYKQGLNSLKQSKVFNFVLFLGSSLGNFTMEQAMKFCKELNDLLSPGDKFLLGVDLVKDPAILLQAYDDPAGITKQFNLNLLQRINRELGGNFKLECFQHYANYDPKQQTMESYLLSDRKQTVAIKDLQEQFQFEAWEPIHTEYSWKYTRKEIEHLAHKCNFNTLHTFTDSRNYYMNILCQVKPRSHLKRLRKNQQ